jgi:serine/threonine protein kinase
LEHRHILPILDYGEEREIVYIVTPYLPTGSLAGILQQGPLSLNEIARILGQIAQALDYAHGRGVLHGVLKPTNVLVDSDRNTYLTDFGIDKLFAIASEPSGIPDLQTLAYMSAEGCKGITSLSPASDVYSLGIITFEMLAGARPFRAETAGALLIQKASAPIPSLKAFRPELMEEVERVVIKALANKPSERFTSAGEYVNTFIRSL